MADEWIVAAPKMKWNFFSVFQRTGQKYLQMSRFFSFGLSWNKKWLGHFLDFNLCPNVIRESQTQSAVDLAHLQFFLSALTIILSAHLAKVGSFSFPWVSMRNSCPSLAKWSCYLGRKWNLYGLGCRSSVKMWYTSVGETPTADAAFLIDNLGKSETMFSSCFLAISRFWPKFLCFGGTCATEPYFSKLDKIFLIKE